MGIFDFNPVIVKGNWESDWSTFVHEITHAILFHPSLFENFVDPITHLPLGKDNIIKTI